jgi:ABC-2 type transport system ATP-binding protein
VSQQSEDSTEALLAALTEHSVTSSATPEEPEHQVTAIELHNVSKYLKTFLAIDRLSLRVRQGEIFGLLGADGAGKTTLLRMLSGLSILTSGEIDVMGYKVPQDIRQLRRVVGFVPQQDIFYEELSAWDNLDFHANLLGVARKEKEQRINSILMLVQLSEYRDAPVKTFTYGMQRRLALGRVLLHNPALVCLDEPTEGVDRHSRRNIWDYILALRTLGKTTVVATNTLEEALELCDHFAVLDCGRLITIETPEQIKRNYGDIVVELEMERPISTLYALRAMPGIQSVKVDGLHLHIILRDNRHILPQVITLLTEENEIKTIGVRELRLSEIFPHLEVSVACER